MLENFDKWVFNPRNIINFCRWWFQIGSAFLAARQLLRELPRQWRLAYLFFAFAYMLIVGTGDWDPFWRETQIGIDMFFLFFVFSEVNSRNFSWSIFYSFKAGRLSMEQMWFLIWQLFDETFFSAVLVRKRPLKATGWNDEMYSPHIYSKGRLFEAQRNPTAKKDAASKFTESPCDGFEARWSIHPQTQHLLTQPLGFVNYGVLF